VYSGRLRGIALAQGILRLFNVVGNDPSPRPREKTVKPKPKLRDQEIQTTLGKEIQTTLGKGQQYRLQDVYAAEEGVLSHPKHLDDKSQNQKSSKLSKIFKPAKKSDENQNTVGGGEQYPTLPQTFIVKYMGNKPSKGYGGAKYIQGPVEEVVEMVNQMPRGSDLPLVKLEVSEEGLHMVPHKRNKVKLFESVSIPIKFISYGSQDQNFPRIFCFIMVREMSSRSKKLDCHVYACDSSKSARKLASCLAFAFHLYQEKMEGQPAQYTTPITNAVSDLSDDAMSSYDA